MYDLEGKLNSTLQSILNEKFSSDISIKIDSINFCPGSEELMAEFKKRASSKELSLYNKTPLSLRYLFLLNWGIINYIETAFHGREPENAILLRNNYREQFKIWNFYF